MNDILQITRSRLADGRRIADHDVVRLCDEIDNLRARVAELEEFLGLADCWITAALECKEWRWDADQHEAATHTRDEIRATLTGGRDG